MITNNLKNFMNLLYISDSANTQSPGSIAVVDVSGTTKYLTPNFGSSSYPSFLPSNINLQTTNVGFKIGTGETAPSENDYCMTSQITSGISSASPTINRTVDSDGNPVLIYIFVLTNTSASDITIKEIGMVAPMFASTSPGTTASSPSNFLIDHTLLESPLTVPAGGNAVLRYERKVVWP